MAALFLALAFAAVGLIAQYLYTTYSYWSRRGVPHEKPLPVLGNMRGIGKTVHFRDITTRLYRRYKHTSPVAGLYMFLSKNLLVLDLDLVKSVLIKDFANFHDRGVFNNVRAEPLVGHLVALEGQQWVAMRHKLSPTFTSGKMKFMFQHLAKVSVNLVETCAQMVAAASASTVEVKELCARFTTDVIGTCAFGLECNSLQNPDAEFRTVGRNIFLKPRHNQLVQAFMFTNPKLAQKLSLKLLTDETTKFFMDAVRSTVEYRVKHGVKRNDFMDMLIEMMAEDQEAARKGDGVDLSCGLTLEQMAAQAFVFFVAGFDTSSTTMSFTIYELAVNPEMQEKLRHEIDEVLRQHNNEVTYEALMSMKYLDKLVAETLRKYPVLPNLLRKCVADYKIPNSEHTIPAGCSVMVPVHAIHYDPEIYPDPERYDPSRFDEDQVKARHPCAYLPFGDGPRNCIGLRFGKMQSKMGIVALIRAFRFSACEQTQIPLELSKRNNLISTDGGILLRVEKL